MKNKDVVGIDVSKLPLMLTFNYPKFMLCLKMTARALNNSSNGLNAMSIAQWMSF